MSISSLIAIGANASNLLSSSSSSIAFSFVDEATSTAMWTSAKVINCTPISDTTNTDYPLDTQSSGNTAATVDYPSVKVILPVRVQAQLVTNQISVLESMITSWLDTTRTFTITAKGIVAKSMTLVSLKMDIDGQLLDYTRVDLEFEQTILGFPSDFSPANPGDSSTYGLGVSAPIQTTNTVSQIASGLASSLGL